MSKYSELTREQKDERNRIRQVRRKTNPESFKKEREATERWHKKYPEKVRANSRRKTLRKYGLTEDNYHSLVVDQGGLCAICEKTCGVKDKLSVDHCHDTKEVRGLLCHHCNLGLGYFNDDVDALANAIKYLNSHKGG